MTMRYERLPCPGDIVLICDQFMGDEYPAIVTLVAAPDMVALTTFPPNQVPSFARAVRFNATDDPLKGTWRWPPKAP